MQMPSRDERAGWVTYYYRGNLRGTRQAVEQGRRPNAQGARNCKPEQPHVLNYLGYSWIDRASIRRSMKG